MLVKGSVLLFADVGDSVQRGFDEFAEWVPNLVGFLAILIVGYFVAKIIGSLIRRLLERAGLDRTLHSGTAGSFISRVTSSPSHLLGRITFWLIFIGAISIAVDVLGIAALEDFVATVWSYVPNVIAALLIFLVAGAIAAGVAGLVARLMGDTTTGRLVATAAPILIMAIAGFMILDQLRIAEEIVTITYASLMGAIALGMALAFGLGGREVAGEMLRGAYENQREQVKQDLLRGKEQAKQDAQHAREKVEAQVEGDAVTAPTQTAEPIGFEPTDELGPRRDPNQPSPRSSSGSP
jgi:Mechanosensitive ion channel, conserved TM helix